MSNHIWDRWARPRKLANLTSTENEFGSHDRWSFTPANEGAYLRCCGCNTLHDVSLAEEKLCRACGKTFTKQELVDASIESRQIGTLPGGWTKERLEALKSKHYYCYMAPDGTVNKINDVARNVAKWAIAQERALDKLRRKVA